eukprot:812964-Rhodomonas_salina.1
MIPIVVLMSEGYECSPNKTLSHRLPPPHSTVSSQHPPSTSCQNVGGSCGGRGPVGSCQVQYSAKFLDLVLKGSTGAAVATGGGKINPGGYNAWYYAGVFPGIDTTRYVQGWSCAFFVSTVTDFTLAQPPKSERASSEMSSTMPQPVLLHQVYISHCIHEAGEQARVLQQALEAEGVSVYFVTHPHLRDEPRKLLAGCRVIVTLATESYGEAIEDRFSSFDELLMCNKLKRAGRPALVVRMCEELALPDPRMHMNIARVKDFEWRGAPQQVPADLVKKILSALAEHAISVIISDDVARKLWFKLDGGVHVHVEPLLASLRKQFTLSESEADGIQKALPAKGGNLSVLGYAQFFEKGLVQSVADFRAKLQKMTRRRKALSDNSALRAGRYAATAARARCVKQGLGDAAPEQHGALSLSLSLQNPGAAP